MRQLRRLKVLDGYRLRASDGEIGKLRQVYFDDRRWEVRYFIVRTGSWLFGKDVLIVPEFVCGVADENRLIDVNLTQKQIKESPHVDTQRPISRHFEQEYFAHYGLTPYWHAEPLLGEMPPYIVPEDQRPPTQPEHPHLRSSDEVLGYQLHANDGEVGQVVDYLLDDQTWSIRYLEIDTGSFFSGKKVLVSPAWIQKLDWAREEVRVDLSCGLIKNAPDYDESEIISRDYEIALYKHYGKARGED